MKIVHSYWSKPSLLNENSIHKSNGGWLHKKYYYFSWALSCLKFKEIYGNIELVTDKAGYELLINTLELPYTSVKVELDILNNYHEKLWAIGKLHAYRIQEEPFLHVDGDVFIWEKLGASIEAASLVAQHREIDLAHYQDAYDDLIKYHHYIPEVITQDYKKHGKIDASNAGIFGGNNIDFFQEYVKKAFDFIDNNIKCLENDNVFGSRFAIMYEQYLFSCMARKNQLEINYFFPDFTVDYKQLSDFKNKYAPKKYTHVIDMRKKLNSYCFELENILRAEFPAYYYKIEKVLWGFK
ncbi:DUF6734 family protein [Ascidiimonas sp. W6]|uniref:DUF6734 family protein n=1 Tax=Ascidiimonas meishanensis TaxID=3128903 RepID=UPI0030EF2D4E